MQRVKQNLEKNGVFPASLLLPRPEQTALLQRRALPGCGKYRPKGTLPSIISGINGRRCIVYLIGYPTIVLMMKLVVMQPYIFPYLGYYQLVELADQFVFFDDVNFIKKGWIHRNAILVQGKRSRFTIPLQQVSQNKTIQETQLHPVEYPIWRQKFLKTLQQSYRHSLYFDSVYTLISEVLHKNVQSIAELAGSSITAVTDYVGINTNFANSSAIPYN